MISGSEEEVENVKTSFRVNNFTTDIGGATITREAQASHMTNIYT